MQGELFGSASTKRRLETVVERINLTSIQKICLEKFVGFPKFFVNFVPRHFFFAVCFLCGLSSTSICRLRSIVCLYFASSPLHLLITLCFQFRWLFPLFRCCCFVCFVSYFLSLASFHSSLSVALPKPLRLASCFCFFALAISLTLSSCFLSWRCSFWLLGT